MHDVLLLLLLPLALLQACCFGAANAFTASTATGARCRAATPGLGRGTACPTGIAQRSIAARRNARGGDYGSEEDVGQRGEWKSWRWRRRRRRRRPWFGDGSVQGVGLETGRCSASASLRAAAVAGSEVAVAVEPLVSEGEGERPVWAPEWAPDWLVWKMHPVVQGFVVVTLYMFHMLFLSRGCLVFPVQLIPNGLGLFQSVGLDTLAGFGVLVGALFARVKLGLKAFPPLSEQGITPWGEPPKPEWEQEEDEGWRERTQAEISKEQNLFKRKKKADRVVPRVTVMLVVAYLATNPAALAWEQGLYALQWYGVPLSVAMSRSLLILLSHLTWVVMGGYILGHFLRPFFSNQQKDGQGGWIKSTNKSLWVWWVLGGYFVSSSLFNVADLINQFVCPLPLLGVESVVTQMINPEGNDVGALAVASIGPCITAPWWEEVLYRGFLLPALTLYMRKVPAIFTGAVMFAAHHMQLNAMLPLTTLGAVWAVLYMLSGNLAVPIIIHAMWNSRVFLGSYLGL